MEASGDGDLNAVAMPGFIDILSSVITVFMFFMLITSAVMFFLSMKIKKDAQEEVKQAKEDAKKKEKEANDSNEKMEGLIQKLKDGSITVEQLEKMVDAMKADKKGGATDAPKKGAASDEDKTGGVAYDDKKGGASEATKKGGAQDSVNTKSGAAAAEGDSVAAADKKGGLTDATKKGGAEDSDKTKAGGTAAAASESTASAEAPADKEGQQSLAKFSKSDDSQESNVDANSQDMLITFSANGISVTDQTAKNIGDYIQKYKDKNGVDPGKVVLESSDDPNAPSASLSREAELGRTLNVRNVLLDKKVAPENITVHNVDPVQQSGTYNWVKIHVEK